MQPTFVSQPIAQRLDAALFLVGERRVHQKGEPVANLQRSTLGDNVIVPQLVEDLGFVPQS